MSQHPHDDLSPVKRALLEMRAMRARIEELEHARTEPVAIIGTGLRLPGGVTTPDAYWKLLVDGIDAITEIPPSRWDAESYYDPDPEAAGKIVTRFGGFLDRIDEFDAAFFGITPREAVAMDPQQRLLLEVAWEALERAGQAPDQLAGTNAGVFIGLSAIDYLTTELKFIDAANIDPYLATGGHPSVASGRLSYVLGLQGPSLTIDTACSSSLTAVHLAVQSLRLGECGLALAGGVNLMLLPELSVNHSRARMLAADGRCKAFDARANGFVRSEGCALVVLKRLSDAVKDGDRIMALIRGTAVNQDGRSSGLTVPNGPAQEAVIREALRRSSMTPDQIDYVEAHGTGTELGDPVELRALGGVFAASRGRGRRLPVGSVKTNIGHLEAAAGVAGLIKVALALEHGVMPPHLHLQTPTPHVDWDALALEVPVTPAEWRRAGHPRSAGVSAFGFSGANAHVVVSEAPASAAVRAGRSAHVLALSAKTEEALRAAAGRWSAFIAEHPSQLADISHTMNTGRAHFSQRAAIVAHSAEDARAALDALSAGTATGVARGSARTTRRPEVAFLFSGQGYEQAGMGRELFDSQPVFRRAIERCDEILRSHLDVPLVSLLYGADQARLHEPRYTQPVLFAFGFALAELWRSWGVEPAFVAGHSLGEDIAACVAGVFTLEQGLEMVAARARIMHANLPEGAMAAVFAPVSEVEQMLQRSAIHASIAAINGREHVVIAGSPEAIGIAVGACERSGLKVRTVPVPRACHSPAMDAVLGDIERLASAMTLAAPRLAFASTLTGRLAGAAELTDPVYWRRHVRDTVRFGDALQALHDAGARIFVEIGPNGSLTSMGRRMFDTDDVAWLPSLKRDGRDWDHILTAVSELYVRGVSIDWTAVDAGCGFVTLDAPTYPFQRQRYWSDEVRPRHAAGAHARAADQPDSGNASVHDIVWRPAVQDRTSPAPLRRILIVGDQRDIADALSIALEARGVEVVIARSHEEWTAAGFQQEDGVVFLPQADRAANQETTGAALQADVVDACDKFVEIIRAIVASGGPRMPRVLCVSAGAYQVGQHAIAVGQAPLAALAAVVNAEHPDLSCVSVDLDPSGTPAAAAAALAEELFQGRTREARVAWRDGNRFVARLVPAGGSGGEISVRGDATYLITGGAGALGSRVADALISSGARHLVLVGRSAANERLEARRRDWINQGADVRYLRADVAGDTFIEQLAAVTGTMPPLAGVCHTAGVLDDGVLLQQNGERFSRVMSPKVAGAWNLHRAVGNQPLDFFVMFSSLASILGTAGQGNYAAANAFLDALAFERRRQGQSATSIAWGPWDDAGMASSAGDRSQRRWLSQGIGRIRIAAGITLFRRLCADGAAPLAAVTPIDWRAYLSGTMVDQRPALFDEIAASLGDAQPSAPTTAASPAPQLHGLAAAERYATLLALAREQVGAILGWPADQRIDPRQGLIDLGVDSLMALEIRNSLQRAVGQTLPATFTFDHPTLDAMATCLAGMLTEATAAEPIAPAVARGDDTEAIAIVGMACRMPGGIASLEEFWTLLHNGAEAIGEIPPSRWNVDDYFDLDPNAPGKMVTRRGGFVSGADLFDPQFFGIAPREAASMDPQQRLLLEVSWEALEHAGVPPDRLHGSRTGVFVGISTNEYAQMQLRRTAVSQLEGHVATGGAPSVAAGRLSYVLGLQGPAMAVDTACSSSLVAVHLACQSLRHGECTTALAGGVSMIFAPEGNVILSRARMLSPDGRCKTFDAAANGYVRSEGCGVVVLKRLSDAVASGDRVLAVVRGSAVNQDGRSGGLTVPNGPAQESLIRDALQSAAVRPSDIDYIEAHGTGTSLGDPIEVRALGSVFAGDRDSSRPLLIGSVKTNVGHLEPAAGIAGLLKVVLALQHREIPPHLHLTSVNPLIQLDAIPAVIPTAPVPWTADNRPRRAGVSSFGFSGTNAHAVIEEAPAAPPRAATERSHHVLTLSAKTATALRDLGARYLDHLDRASDPFADVAFTANSGRNHFEHRIAIAAATAGEARTALASRLASLGDDEPAERPKLAFLFTGQGAQYPGMARELYASQPAFARAFDACARLLDDQLPQPLRAVVFDERRSAELIDQTAFTQPALFAVEYALAEMWQSWGVRPSAAIGHSVGEFAAACAAGVLTLEDAAALIATRGRLMQALPSGGAMAAVFSSEARVGEAIAACGGRVAIAAVNAADHVVISGDAALVGRVTDVLRLDGIESRPLSVSHAFHSPLITPMLDEFERAARRVDARAPSIALISNVTGRRVQAHERCDGAYWRAHAAQPVRFADGMRALAAEACRLFLEVGPNPTLIGIGRRTVTEPGTIWLSSLRKGRGDWQQLGETLAALYEASFDPDWRSIDGDSHRRIVTVPSYPFQRQRYWIDEAKDSEHGARQSTDRWTSNHAYSVTWQPKAVPSPASAREAQTWMVLVDDHGFGAEIGAALRARGVRCIEVRAGATTAEKAVDQWQVAPDQRDGFERALSQLRGTGVTQIVNCWPLDAPAVDADTTTLEASHVKTCGGMLHLTQALTSLKVPARLWVVTRQAVAVRGDEGPTGALQSTAWGFGRVVALEHPEVWGGLIDLDGGVRDGAAGVLSVIDADDGEDQVALRAGQRFVARLMATPSVATTTVAIRRDGTYLVTGGTGNLGLRIATHLARLGAGHLVLLSRSSQLATAEPEAACREIEALGARVTVFKGDVTLAADLDRLRAELAAWPPLRGLVHAAALIDARPVNDLQLADLLNMLRPKVTGTLLLDRLTHDAPLDFFVLFSSIAGVFGAIDSAHYAAANVFLDAFAHLRRSAGSPMTSVSWGTWDVVRGTAAELDKINRGGMKSIATPVGLEAFTHLLRPSAPHVVVGDVDWHTLKPLYETKRLRPFFALVGDTARQAGGKVTIAPTALTAQLRSARPAERRGLLQAHIREIAAEVLGLKPAQVDVKKGLFDLGMDSLMSVDLRDRLAAALGHNMPSTLTFNYPSVAAMTDFVASVVQLDVEVDAANANAAGPAVVNRADDHDELSEDELASLLAARLEQIPS